HTRSLRDWSSDVCSSDLTHVVADGRHPEGVDAGDRGLGDRSVASVVGLEPGRARTVVLRHDERKLGAVVSIPPDGPAAPEMTVRSEERRVGKEGSSREAP